MSNLQIGVTLQSERLALNLEIGRNIGGGKEPEAPVHGNAPVQQSLKPPTAAQDIVLPDEQPIDRPSLSTTANALIGLRPPLATFTQLEAYDAAIARLAQSLNAAAAMPSAAPTAGGNGVADHAVPANRVPDETLPQHQPIDWARPRPAAPGFAGSPAPLAASQVPARADVGATDEPIASLAAEGKFGAPAATTAADIGRRDILLKAMDLGVTPSSGADLWRATAADHSAPASLVPNSVSAVPTQPATPDIAQDRAASLAAAADAPAPSPSLAKHGLPETAIERGLMAFAFADAAGNAGPQAERAGVIASFILNAHFMPGWPPPRPIQAAEAKALLAQAAATTKLSKAETDMLVYLTNMGLNKKQIARVLKLLSSAQNRSKFLDAIAAFFVVFGTLMNTMREELDQLAEELTDARTGGSQGKRSRIDLR